MAGARPSSKEITMPAIALVAAGARLGLSLGKTFGGHGFDVALLARSPERLDELTEKLAAEGVTAAGTGTLLYTTGASSVTPAPVFVSAGMAGAALRKWALTLNAALAHQGIYAGHVAIGTWIAGTPGAPEGAALK